MKTRALAEQPDGESSPAGALRGSVMGGADDVEVTASGPTGVVITGEDWLDRICPFLRALDGSWRSASPVREHRCWATDPASELAVLTQQRLCLVREHDGCERFLHARELRSASLARDRSGGASPRSPVGPRRRSSRHAGSRAAGTTAALASRIVARPRMVIVAAAALALMVAVVFLLGGAGIERPTATGGVAVSVSPGGATEAPGVVDGSPGADGLRRYRVRQGDTLRTIADRFGISVRQVRAVNDLGDPPRLEPGDIILVPLG